MAATQRRYTPSRLCDLVGDEWLSGHKHKEDRCWRSDSQRRDWSYMFTTALNPAAPSQDNHTSINTVKKTTGIISYLCSGELSPMDAMHLLVLLYESKIYLFLINYLFIIACCKSLVLFCCCFFNQLYTVGKSSLFISQISHADKQLMVFTDHNCFSLKVYGPPTDSGQDWIEVF